MKKDKIKVILKEVFWLIAIVGGSAFIEFVIIEMLDLHPVLSIKIQGLIGLMLIGYGIRMVFRLWKSFHTPSNPDTNGQEDLE
ncbi:MAG: hypothetical protein HUJ22_09910 [Gracilimonas sp.]|uniref:hypothetical protein n=1 Tax=Gracilimonas sp. TaxID=1974203 RepID=UPI0019B1F64E|nr:hypothetical protein [Gracilimonas sp.]MBD3616876.1 hypothetical protein [Gracilimonas sp.]